jgi:hypothetical protein
MHSGILEVLREAGRADHSCGQWRFVDEQEVVDEVVRDFTHGVGAGIGPARPIGQERHQVDRAGLMFQHHQRRDIAICGRISREIELIPERFQPSLPYSIAAMPPAT